jgi:hypothetical protein
MKEFPLCLSSSDSGNLHDPVVGPGLFGRFDEFWKGPLGSHANAFVFKNPSHFCSSPKCTD